MCAYVYRFDVADNLVNLLLSIVYMRSLVEYHAGLTCLASSASFDERTRVRLSESDVLEQTKS